MSSTHSRRSFLARCSAVLGAAVARLFGGKPQAAAVASVAPDEPIPAEAGKITCYSYSAEEAFSGEAPSWVSVTTYDALGRIVQEQQVSRHCEYGVYRANEWK